VNGRLLLGIGLNGEAKNAVQPCFSGIHPCFSGIHPCFRVLVQLAARFGGAQGHVVFSGKSAMKFRKFSMQCAALAILIAGVFLSTVPASAQGFKWWQSDSFKRELGLTADQSTKIEAIFQRTLPALRTLKGALDKAEADFNQMVEASDDAQVMAQVGVVEAARSELNKSRTMMLLRMRRVLTPDQRVKFVMLQQRTRDRRRAGDDHQR
jgi:Spy/CpxP family protein refolding chaperone